MALDIPHPVVEDTQQTLNLSQLKDWSDETDQSVTNLDSQVAALDTRLDTAEAELVSLDARLDTVEAIESVRLIGQAGQPAFANSWVNYDISTYKAAGFYKDRNRVFLQGLVKSGSFLAVMFTMPVGYRPTTAAVFTVISNGAIGRVDITSAGEVIAVSGSSTWVSLDGISVRV